MKKLSAAERAAERLNYAEAIIGWTLIAFAAWTVSLPLQWGTTPGRWLAVQGIAAFWVFFIVFSNHWNRSRDAKAEDLVLRHTPSRPPQ